MPEPPRSPGPAPRRHPYSGRILHKRQQFSYFRCRGSDGLAWTGWRRLPAVSDARIANNSGPGRAIRCRIGYRTYRPPTTSTLRYHGMFRNQAQGLAMRHLKNQGSPKDVYGKEIEFGIERALDAFRFAEAVLLARKQEISDRQTFSAQFLNHGLGLAGRHHPVLLALEENHRNREPLSMKQR